MWGWKWYCCEVGVAVCCGGVFLQDICVPPQHRGIVTAAGCCICPCQLVQHKVKPGRMLPVQRDCRVTKEHEHDLVILL